MRFLTNYLITSQDQQGQALIAQGFHVPAALTRQTGVWIHAAGSLLLTEGCQEVRGHSQWVWLAVDTGEAEFRWRGESAALKDGEALVIPAGGEPAALYCASECRCLYIAFDGPLAPTFLQQMGSVLHTPLKQGILPSQMYLARQIVQVIVRHSGTCDATYQLQQLMWGMLASHSGQPVAMDAMLSHEIAKVVDALRANQYKDNFSLAEMAAISRMPLETFRKRFVAEVGMPPLGYLLYCKMERAKSLLQERCSVRQAGVEVGMQDPYHFSKQFKNIVGMSPSAYMRQATQYEPKNNRGGKRRSSAGSREPAADVPRPPKED